MKKSTVGIIIVIILMIIAIVVFAFNTNTKKENTATNEEQNKVENEQINEIQTNEIENNEIEDNEIKENIVENTTTVENRVSTETFEESPKTAEEKAVDIVKKDWQQSGNAEFSVEGLDASGNYIVVVRNNQTTQALAFYNVNISNGTFTKKEMN